MVGKVFMLIVIKLKFLVSEDFSRSCYHEFGSTSTDD